MVEGADERLNAVYVLYEYAIGKNGESLCELWRERLVRAGEECSNLVDNVLVITHSTVHLFVILSLPTHMPSAVSANTQMGGGLLCRTSWA